MKHITTTLLLFLSLGVMAQKNCKPNRSFDDSFSGKHYDLYGGRLDIPPSTFKGTTTYIDIYQYQSDSSNYIMFLSKIYQREYDVTKYPITFGDSATFHIRTQEGILNFSTFLVSQSKSKIGVNVITAVEMHAYITEEQITQLVQNPIISYRIVPSGYETIQGEVAKKKAGKIQAQFTCYHNN